VRDKKPEQKRGGGLSLWPKPQEPTESQWKPPTDNGEPGASAPAGGERPTPSPAASAPAPAIAPAVPPAAPPPPVTAPPPPVAAPPLP